MPVVLVDRLASAQDVHAGGNRTDAPATLSTAVRSGQATAYLSGQQQRSLVLPMVQYHDY